MKGNMRHLVLGVYITSVVLSRVQVWRLQQPGVLTMTSQSTLMLTSIQDAMDNASAGDGIIAYPGTYTENVDVNKCLTIQ